MQRTRWKELLIAALALISLSLGCFLFAAQGEISHLSYQLSVEMNRAAKNARDLANCRRLLGDYDRGSLMPEEVEEGGNR